MITKILSLNFIFILTTISLTAQKIPDHYLEDFQFRNIGPAGMSGRITTIDVSLRDENMIYIGTASGGIWKSTNGGTTWTPIFDREAVQSIGAIAIDPTNDHIIWAGTGEGNPRNSHNSGKGIYKSLDGGKTWIFKGLEETKLIHRIIIDPQDPNNIYVAAMGSAWGPNPQRGIYRSRDGGNTWKKVLYVNEETGAADLIMDPLHPNKLIAAMWEFGRKPWFFNSGGPGSGIYISQDHGETWSRINDRKGLPKGPWGRIGLAMSTADTDIIYALIEAKENALYRSEDAGRSWKKVPSNNVGNRPFYYADIYADPCNANRLYNLYSYLSKSEDGGKTFERIRSRIHPDHHAFWIHPEDPDYLIDGNDGGLNISRDGGKTWRFVENLPLGQFYHIDYDFDIPYHVFGGLQDNGSWIGPSTVWQRGGIRNSHWQEVLYGDGFDVILRRDNNRYGWAMYQGGNVSYFDRKTGKTVNVKPVHPEGVPLRFSWNAAISADPFNDCGLYFGSQFVHKSTNCGKSWKIISPDLTTNDTSKQKQHLSGGLTIDNTRAENFTTILSIAPSPLDSQVIWVGTDDGHLQLTRDGGGTWQELSGKLPEFPTGAWIPFIELSPKNAGEAFVIVNDYRRNNWEPYLYHTKNFGKSWKRLADGEQVSGHTLSIVQDNEAPSLLFLGTDFGLYFSLDYGKNWQKWSGFPSVSTRDLKIHPRENDLIAGTFGRSVWILDNIEPLRALAHSGKELLNSELRTFPLPNVYLAYRKPPQGVRSTADAYFQGDNRGTGAYIPIWIGPNAFSENEKEKKVRVHILDESRDTIRTFSAKRDTGFHTVYWSLNRNGVNFPGRKPQDDPPGGPSVMPGDYLAVVQLDSLTDSVRITVKPDPRVEYNRDEAESREALINDLFDIVKIATKAYQNLEDARQTINRINDHYTHAPDSIRTMIKDRGKEMQDSLTALKHTFHYPKDMKGIQRTSDKLNSILYEAYGAISGSPGDPFQMAILQLERAREKTRSITNRINQFFSEKWTEYQQLVEANEANPFPDNLILELKE